jgi:hypothetical protein
MNDRAITDAVESVLAKLRPAVEAEVRRQSKNDSMVEVRIDSVGASIRTHDAYQEVRRQHESTWRQDGHPLVSNWQARF